MSAVVNSRVHPKTWIVAGVCAGILAFVPLPAGGRLALLLCEIVALVTAGQTRRYVPFLVGLLPVAAMSFLIQAISFHGATILARWSWGFLTFTVTREGLDLGMQLGLQILCFGTACALISLPVAPSSLRVTLLQWRVPARLVYLLVASINAPTQLRRYANIAQESVRARGVPESGIWNRVRASVRVAGVLMSLVLLEHESRGLSLHQRGLEDAESRVFLHQQNDNARQKIARWVLLGLTALVLSVLAMMAWSGR